MEKRTEIPSLDLAASMRRLLRNNSHNTLQANGLRNLQTERQILKFAEVNSQSERQSRAESCQIYTPENPLYGGQSTIWA